MYINPIPTNITFDYEALIGDERFVYPFADDKIDILLEQGGRATRKTWRTIFTSIAYGLKGESTMIIRNVAGTNKTSVYSDYVKILNEHGIPYKTKTSPQPYVEYLSSNGKKSSVFFRGLDNTEKLKGTVEEHGYNPFGIVWFEEALEMMPKSSLKEVKKDLNDIIQSFRSNKINKLKQIYSYNPKWTGHWLHDWSTTELEDNMRLHISTIYDNPYLPDWYIKSIERYKDTWHEQWLIMAMGQWANTGEKVYNIREDDYYDHIPVDNFLKINIGIDLGRKDPTSFTAVGFTDNYRDVYILDNYVDEEFESWSKTKNDLIKFVHKIRQQYPNHLYMELHCEYAQDGNAFIREVEAELQKQGLPISIRKAQKILIQDRINYFNYLLSEKRLKLKPNTYLDEEMIACRYDPKGNRMDKNDHGINSAEYGIVPERELLKLGLFFKSGGNQAWDELRQ